MHQRRTLFAVWSITCLIWSTVWLFIRLGVQDVPPISLAALRLLIAVFVLLPILRVRRLALPGDTASWRLIGSTGLLLLGVNYALVFWGAKQVPSGLMALLQAATPAFGLVFAQLVPRGEPMNGAKVSGIALGIVGVALIVRGQVRFQGDEALLGYVAVIASAACVALAYVVLKAHGSQLDPLVLITGQMIVAVVPLMAAGLVLDGNPMALKWSARSLGALVYLALAGSVAAFWLNYWLLRRMDASGVLAMSLVEPLLAVLLGFLVLGERLTASVVVGGLAVLASVWLVLSTASAGQAAASGEVKGRARAKE